MRAPRGLARIADDGSADLLLALALSAFLVISLAAEDLLHGADNLLRTACAVGVLCCLIPRRADPQLSALAAAILFAVSALGSLATIPSELDDVVVVPVVLLAYSLGTAADQRRSAVIAALLTAGLLLQDGVARFNPILLALAIGPWAAGLVVRWRRSPS
ncbi:MAG TPA: hypothetical protein VHZ33_39690 [Trebonia sp.]|jgi:hypothetical protein|nr:hypothetical protein [Trebonia sp.]